MTIPEMSVASILGEPMSNFPCRTSSRMAVKAAPIAEVTEHIVNGAGKLASAAACVCPAAAAAVEQW